MSWPEFYILAKIMAANYEAIFREVDGAIYIVDPSPNCSFQGKNSSKISSFFKKMKQIVSEEESKFLLSKFQRPTLDNIRTLKSVNCTTAQEFFKIAKIREIKLKYPFHPTLPLKNISCTCPDFRCSSFCLHTLAILVKKKIIKDDMMPKNKQRGRNAQDAFSWQSENESNEETKEEDNCDN